MHVLPLRSAVALVWQSSRQPAFAVAASSNSCSHARLSSKVPGTKPWEGVLEVLREGRWGTVCINYFYFTSHNGEVACREMGFSGYEEYVSPADVSPRYGDFSDVSPVINDIRCKGMESGLLQCPNLQNVSEVSNSCSSPYYAALRCKGLCVIRYRDRYSDYRSITMLSRAELDTVLRYKACN